MGAGQQRAKAHERRIAKRTGGARVPLSGAGNTKGDVHTEAVFYECKSSARKTADGVKSISVRKDDLTKMLQQQAKEGKTLHAMVLHFAGDQKDWVVIEWRQWESLLGSQTISVQPGQ